MKNQKVIAVAAGSIALSLLMVRCTSPRIKAIAPADVQSSPSTSPSPSTGSLPISGTEPAETEMPTTYGLIIAARDCNPSDTEQNCNRAIGQALDSVRLDYETDRVNGAIIAARNEAVARGVQSIEVLREWQRKIANDYVYEIQHGKGENSRKVREQLIYRFSIAMLAESVVLQNQPMQAIDIPEQDLACMMQAKVGVLGVSCRSITPP